MNDLIKQHVDELGLAQGRASLLDIARDRIAARTAFRDRNAPARLAVPRLRTEQLRDASLELLGKAQLSRLIMQRKNDLRHALPRVHHFAKWLSLPARRS